MVQLLDYAGALAGGQSLVPDWAQRDLAKRFGGLQADAQSLQNRLAQQQIAANDAQVDDEQRFKADWIDLSQNPTAAGFSRVLGAHPKFQQQAKAAWDAHDKERQRIDLRDMSSLYSYAQAGQYEKAAGVLTRRIDAAKAAGDPPDPEDTAMRDQLLSGNPELQKQVVSHSGLALSAIVGPDKLAATLGALNEADQTKDYTLSPGQRRYAADGSMIAEAPFAPRPVTVREGETVVEYDPNSKGGGPASGGGAATALRTNPGAIKDGSWARSQPGYTGSSGGFATFASPEAGIAAQSRLLRDQYVGAGYNTPRKLIERYAPRGENSDASVNNYIAYVARKLGVGPDDAIPPARVPQLAQAIREFETGNRSSGGARTIAVGATPTKDAPKPTETRSLGGKIYVKINGDWYLRGNAS